MRFFTLLLILFQSLYLAGQGGNQLYSILQYCGTEAKLLKHIETPINVYKVVILLEPNACPRCESSFKVLNDYFVQNEIQYEYILTGSEFNKIMLEKYAYLNSKVTHKDSEIIYDLFKLSEGKVQVPFLLKIDRYGKLVYQKSMLGIVINNDLVIEIDSSLNENCIDNSNDFIVDDTFEMDLLSLKKILNADAFAGYNVLGINNVSDDDYAIIETVTASVQYVNIDTDSIMYTTRNSELETNYFNSEIPKDVMEKLDDYNILKTIYLKVVFADRDGFKVIASIPHVVLEEDGYGYFNEPVIVHKKWNGDIVEIKMIDIDMDDHYVLKHAKTYTDGKGLICYKVVKGWPAVGTINEADKLSIKNINTDVFYENAFEYKCKCDGGASFDLGQLTDVHKDYKLGYYFDYTGIKFLGDTIVFWDGITGSLDFMSFNKEKASLERIDRIELFSLDYNDSKKLIGKEVVELSDLKEREVVFGKHIKALAFDISNNRVFSIVDFNKIFVLMSNDLTNGNLLSTQDIELLKIDYIFGFEYQVENDRQTLELIFESDKNIYNSEFLIKNK